MVNPQIFTITPQIVNPKLQNYCITLLKNSHKSLLFKETFLLLCKFELEQKYVLRTSEGGKPFYAAKNVVFAISSVVNDRSFSVETFLAFFLKPTVYLSFKSSTFFKFTQKDCFFAQNFTLQIQYNACLLQH
jgi:hypothetical protein